MSCGFLRPSTSKLRPSWLDRFSPTDKAKPGFVAVLVLVSSSTASVVVVSFPFVVRSIGNGVGLKFFPFFWNFKLEDFFGPFCVAKTRKISL